MLYLHIQSAARHRLSLWSPGSRRWSRLPAGGRVRWRDPDGSASKRNTGERRLTRSRASLFSDARVGVVGAAGSAVSSGLASIIIARELGVTGRGRWAVIASLTLLVATVASSGLPTAASYAGARLRANDQLRLVQAATAGAVALGSVAGLIYLGVALIVRPPAPAVAVLAALAIPAGTVWFAVTHALTLTVATMRWYAIPQLVISVVTLAGVIALALTVGLTVLTVVIVSSVSLLCGVALNLVGLSRHGGFRDPLLVTRPATVVQVLRPFVVYAMVTFATLSLTQIMQRVDILLVNAYRGPHAAGLYAVAVQFTDLILVIPGALGFVMFRRAAGSAPDHWDDVMVVLRWLCSTALWRLS